jgi:hypothetical protein
MRRCSALSCLAIVAMILVAAGLAGCGSSSGEPTGPASSATAGASSGFAVGHSVAATWTDGNLYLANVTAVDGDEVTVTFADDGSSLAVAAADVRTIPETAFAVGDRVLAVWQNGRFCPARSAPWTARHTRSRGTTAASLRRSRPAASSSNESGYAALGPRR